MVLDKAQLAKLQEFEGDGASVYPVMSRYDKSRTGRQWLGYLAEQPEVLSVRDQHTVEVKQPFALKSGAAGLERTLDPC